MLTRLIGENLLACNMAKKKSQPQKRHWMGTIQLGHLEHHTDTFMDWWEVCKDAPDLVYAIAQIEEAETGTLHIQVYTEWKTSLRRSEVSKRAGMGHWEPRRGSRTQCRDYCRKKDSRVEKLGEFGEWRPDIVSNPVESPKAQAIAWLMEGLTPAEICAKSPEVFFTHHRSILETWKMLQTCNINRILQEEE